MALLLLDVDALDVLCVPFDWRLVDTEEMKSFVLWFLQELPDFLMAEPVCYFVALGILVFVVDCISQLLNINS